MISLTKPKVGLPELARVRPTPKVAKGRLSGRPERLHESEESKPKVVHARRNGNAALRTSALARAAPAHVARLLSMMCAPTRGMAPDPAVGSRWRTRGGE